MPPWRRTLTVQESLRVAKFFYTLLEIQGGNILFKFYPKDEQALQQNYIDYEMGQLHTTSFHKNFAFTGANPSDHS